MLRQDVLWTVETDYAGSPYHVSGNAILHALAHNNALDYSEQRNIGVSHGVFVPSVYGVFPNWHSESGGRGNFASTLKPIEKYEDLFLFRRPQHEWIHDGRPRDAVNTPSQRTSRGNILLQPSHGLEMTSRGVRTVRWLLHAYLTAEDGADIIPLEESALDGIQVGGKRNYGLGELSLKDSTLTDLSTLDYTSISDADSHVVELITPYVLKSQHPHTHNHDIPQWWDQELRYRRRHERIYEQNNAYDVTVVDHGQITRYEGHMPTKTAKNGIARVGPHSKYGFGELWMRPAKSRSINSGDE